jgi:hypothetical protein
MHQIKILLVYHERREREREVHIGKEGETREMKDNLVGERFSNSPANKSYTWKNRRTRRRPK